MWIKWRKLWKTLPIFFEISRSAGSYMPYGHQIFPLFAARRTTNTQARDLFPVSRTKPHHNTPAAAASAPPRGKLSLPGALIPFARTAPVHIKAPVRALNVRGPAACPSAGDSLPCAYVHTLKNLEHKSDLMKPPAFAEVRRPCRARSKTVKTKRSASALRDSLYFFR